jgi:hypothetical protein
MSRRNFGLGAGLQPTLSPHDGGAGNPEPEPELDPPCMEGRPDEKNALEDRVSRLLGPPQEKPVMPQLGLPQRKCRNSRHGYPAREGDLGRKPKPQRATLQRPPVFHDVLEIKGVSS